MKAYFAYVNARRGPDGKRGVDGPSDHLQVLRRRLQHRRTRSQLTRRLVEQDKVFATVGQLGTEPVLAVRGLHEPAEGAAGARLDRGLVLGHAVQGVPVDDRLAARLHRRGTPLRSAHQGELSRARRSRSCTRTTTTARTTSTGSARRSARSTPTRTSSPRRPSRRRRPRVASQMMRITASGAPILVVFQLPSPTITTHRDGQGARHQPRADLPELGGRDQAGHGRTGRGAAGPPT